MSIKPEQALSGFKKGRNCSQAVISVYSEEFGLSRQTALEIAHRFEKRNDSIICKDLLGCDISEPEGATAARTNGLFTSVCPKLVRDAAEILEEMLK